MTSRLSPIIALCIIFLISFINPASSIRLDGTRSHAKYPKWNACVNATFSFEFKTTQRNDALLMYVDDGGTYDFVEVSLHNGHVKLVLNIVDGRDGRVYMEIGNNVNDGRWHRVDILRNRMETTLIVDGQTDSKFAFGSDFLFGDISKNSHVFFGGLPEFYTQNVYKLALPSALHQPNLRGHIRNVLYGNCTCQTQRAVMIGGENVDNSLREVCEIRNPCRDGCLCISNDTEPACDCSELQCVTGKII
jgi:leucine-rich repeat transmembrane neuronal protein 1/2